ncbi:ABC-type Fe3+/spermidine/putrescine transport systems, ATPase components [Cohaesibacter sp. ES.047]|uniref:ABC transporter ATP-binding protein n=1 Tax=Cohaesibacter sp. ES.047 TaxID=1798205 RepID=UPI000BB983B4|nr:ABC transporter ATP-binding protein [Cohaesibacter sp. ES.047]SNY91661.1 ABC-type Fe3+/spermidine/putrescine transport systems, ATPase components [Cohaesibacter sp. ES.047]
MTAISLRNLSKTFGTFTALSEMSLDVNSGEFLTLLGPSGCGKTTLLKLISGFLEPTSGSISINGKDVTNIPPEARDTALCFQSYALFPHLTVRANLEFGLRQKKLPAKERNERVADVAAKLELKQQMDRLPNQLSGGQQQRVSLGRALVMRPSVILFDEPLSNLDAKLRDQVRIEIRRIQREYGLTAIYVTHDQAEALAMSDRVVVLNEGRTEQVDSPEAIYSRPRTGFVADFIGDANVIEGVIGEKGAEGCWQVETPVGHLQLPFDAGETGSRVFLGWRPEKVSLGQGALSGIVKNRAFQGHYTDLMIETNGFTHRIQVSESSAQEGDLVHFDIPVEHLIALEAGL